MRTAVATIHGAVSIVNAVATFKGATLGTSLTTTARISVVPGQGIIINSANQSSRLINLTIQNIVPAKELERNRITVSVSTQMPTGCGLKSSSAITTAVSMACAKILNPEAGEKQILAAGVNASVKSGVSITGAYDDVCGCYYGGFNVTHNKTMSLVKRRLAPPNLIAVIFVPNDRHRRNTRELRKVSEMLNRAWLMAQDERYWDAMTMNGLAVSPVLGPTPRILNSLLERGALAASLSGNGPAIAAVARHDSEQELRRAFTGMIGRVIVTPINNKKAVCDEL